MIPKLIKFPHLSSEESDGDIDGETVELGNLESVLERGAGAVQVDVLQSQRLLRNKNNYFYSIKIIFYLKFTLRATALLMSATVWSSTRLRT